MNEVIARGIGAFSLGLAGGAVTTTFLGGLLVSVLLYAAIMGFIHAEKRR